MTQDVPPLSKCLSMQHLCLPASKSTMPCHSGYFRPVCAFSGRHYLVLCIQGGETQVGRSRHSFGMRVPGARQNTVRRQTATVMVRPHRTDGASLSTSFPLAVRIAPCAITGLAVEAALAGRAHCTGWWKNPDGSCGRVRRLGSTARAPRTLPGILAFCSRMALASRDRLGLALSGVHASPQSACNGRGSVTTSPDERRARIRCLCQ